MGNQYKVEVDRALCIACNVCVVACNNFEIVTVSPGEEKSQPKQKVIQEQIEEHLCARDVCPTSAITVEKLKKT